MELSFSDDIVKMARLIRLIRLVSIPLDIYLIWFAYKTQKEGPDLEFNLTNFDGTYYLISFCREWEFEDDPAVKGHP
eukprot:CAMPEP_0114300716 /NCGR_PEP_ID=MMETSP0059-20121206/13711_1 /TAXON_ID=36894 /ORGANISM="Pyramimonas parkeae, Strain CCMP726" /LENGTH=76 /DNA_ID=CAMNT_0001423385 /DNA_START=491 /DNA_END=721 /DNA_ORIENTATION=-